MPRNGSGTYTAPANSVNPAVPTTTIGSSDFNDMLSDIETALSESMARDGQTTTTAVIPFASGVKTDTIVENSSNTGVTVDSVLIKDGGVQLGTSGTLVFEGSTADANETTLTVVDPTADRTLTLPNATDTIVGRATTDTLTNKTLTSAVLNTGVSGTAVLDEDNMASNSATQLATQQSIKAYIDNEVAGAGVSQATQSAIEAETNEDTYIPPDLIKHSPGVAKAWVDYDHVAVGIQASYNVSSVTDNSTGILTVNFSTNFSAANYAVVVTGEEDSSGNNARITQVQNGGKAVGSCVIENRDAAGSLRDFPGVHVVFFGDQA